MKFMFVSKYGDSLPLAVRCEKEGNEVNFFCEVEGVGDGIVHTVQDTILGPDTIIVFDDPVYGRRADDYRSQGYAVIGASVFGSNLELIEEYNNTICKLMDSYALPQNSYIESWFNGHDWVIGATSVSVYDSHFLAGDLGVDTGFESGTTCFLKRLRPVMFKKTLGKLTSVLKRVEYTGPIRFNKKLSTGFNVMNIYSLPLIPIPCGRILADVARGNLKRVVPSYDYNTVVRVSEPPYPYDNGKSTFVSGIGSSVAMSRETALLKAEGLSGKEKQYRVDAGARANALIPRLLKEEVSGKR